MGDVFKADTLGSVGKKVYYVIKLHAFTYLGNIGGPGENIRVTFDARRENAARFDTVKAALTFITQGTWAGNKRDRHTAGPLAYLSANMTLARIEETPGTSTVRLVSTTKIDATKPVVIFGDACRSYFRSGSQLGAALTNASVFNDLEDALRSIGEGGPTGPLHIHQVEVVPGTPTITETVLS